MNEVDKEGMAANVADREKSWWAVVCKRDTSHSPGVKSVPDRGADQKYPEPGEKWGVVQACKSSGVDPEPEEPDWPLHPCDDESGKDECESKGQEGPGISQKEGPYHHRDTDQVKDPKKD
jgi:hypothetical protein